MKISTLNSWAYELTSGSGLAHLKREFHRIQVPNHLRNTQVVFREKKNVGETKHTSMLLNHLKTNKQKA